MNDATVSQVRPIDRARARAAMLAAATQDGLMLSGAVADAAEDEQWDAVHLLVAAIAEDAVASLVDSAAKEDVEEPLAAVVAALRIALAAALGAAAEDEAAS